MEPNRSPASAERRVELALHIAVLLAVLGVMLPVVLNPTEVLYSERSDILGQHHPFRELQAESLRERGELQLWNATSFGGGPLLGDPQAGLFYPPNWLHALSSADGGAAWFGWIVILHLLLGGFGMLRWLKGHGFGPWSRLAGALVLMLCGKFFNHVVLPGQIVFLPLMWVPWQLLALDRLAAGRSPPAVALLALATAMCITGLHPQILLYSQILVLGYVFVPRARPAATTGSSWRLLTQVAAAGLLGLALAAVQLLPAGSVIDSFVRSQGVNYEKTAVVALGERNLLAFLLPDRLSPERWELAVFVGVMATVCSLFAPWRKRFRAVAIYFFACFVGILWFATGDDGGLYCWIFEWVPGFDLFRFPTRVLLIMGMPLGYLAAAGIEVLGEGRSSRGIIVPALLLAAGGVAILILCSGGDAILVGIALAAPALVLLPWARRLSAWRPAALTLLLFVDHACFAIPLVRTRPLDEALGDNPIIERVQAPLGRSRVLAADFSTKADVSSLPVTYATPARIEGLRGFNPLVPRASYLYLHAGVGKTPIEKLDWRTSTTMPTFPLASRKHLDLFNVRWIVSNQQLKGPGLKHRESFDDIGVYHFQRNGAFSRQRVTHLYENVRFMPRAALVRGARSVSGPEEAIAAIPRLDPRSEVLVEGEAIAGRYGGEFEAVEVQHEGDEISLTVDAGEGGYLVLSEVWYPGWCAEVDGEAAPLLRANGIFQALHLTPGPHEIRLRYWSSISPVSLLISAAAGAIVTALLVIGWRRAMKSGPVVDAPRSGSVPQE